MKQQLEPLFTPWKIGNCEIKNRIVLTSMGGTNLLGWMEAGVSQDGSKAVRPADGRFRQIVYHQ